MNTCSNTIRVKINTSIDFQEIKKDQNIFNNGYTELKIERLKCYIYDIKNYKYNEEKKILVGIIGYISNLESIKNTFSVTGDGDCDIIEMLYSKIGDKFINELDGVFTILICDYSDKKIYIYRDKYGSNIPLYYSMKNNNIIICNELKEVLRSLNGDRELDIIAANDFIFSENHIIPNNSTLVKGIKKLMPWQFLCVDGKKNSLKACKRRDINIVRKKNYKTNPLIPAIKKSIKDKYENLTNTQISCTLSSGYDTNILLHFLSELSNSSLSAYTIGGKEKNEIPDAQEIATNYDNVVHRASIISEEIIENLPYIVWITEGYTGQKGIFLQYTLAKRMTDDHTKIAFLGDGADQILDQYRFSKLIQLKNRINGLINNDLKNKLKNILNMFLSGKRKFVIREGDVAYTKEELELISRKNKTKSKDDFDETLNYILLKNGLFSNYFGIQCVYPFLDQNIKGISRSLWKLNKRKAYYKRQVIKVVKPLIGKKLVKIGGDTDIEYLFNNKTESLRKMLKAEILNRILSKEIIKKIAEKPENYPVIMLRLVIVYIFYQLFIISNADLKEENIPRFVKSV